MISNKLNRLVIIVTFTIFSFSLFNGCDTNEPTDATLSFSFYSGSSVKKNVVDPIGLDSAKFILYDINIKEQSGTDSKGVKVGPFLVYLNISGITTDFALGNIPPGFYDHIKFEVHQLKDSEPPPDPDFIDGSIRFSAIIKGTYNSVPFIYKYKKSAKQDLKLITPIEVTDNSIANLTIIVDPDSWFDDNGNILDPNDPTNESLIEDNIKQSFKKIIIDNNHDGLAD